MLWLITLLGSLAKKGDIGTRIVRAMQETSSWSVEALNKIDGH